FMCDPDAPDASCPAGPHEGAQAVLRSTQLVELPVGASDDRVAGSIDIERALAEGARAFEPGLLAAANRGILYVDEVNLLSDHLVDLLLDAAAMGMNHVEREGVSVRHAARFLLVGTMNPEEGELRPQLLDRFGLTVEITAPRDRDLRAEVVRRRLAYEADPVGFSSRFESDETRVATQILAARGLLDEVDLPERELDRIVAVCAAFEVDGLRADIITAKAARAHAAWEGRTTVGRSDVRCAALLTLPHRRRRQPFESPGIDEDLLDRVLDDGFRPHPPPSPGSRNGTPEQDSGQHDPSKDGTGPQDVGSRQSGPRPAPSRARDDRAMPADERRPTGEAPSVASGGRQDHDRPGVSLPERSFAAGQAFRPVLLTLPGVGAGAWGRRSPSRGDHGRPERTLPAAEVTRDRLALSATVRAAAPYQPARGRSQGGPLQIHLEDLRATVREGREGNLIVFVLDASGSMGARRRMVAVKGAVRSLLLDAYQRRDEVALVAFRGAGAELVLPPTSSVELAERRLALLPTGGGTPLAAGLIRAGELVAVESIRDPQRRPLLVLLTDGRANGGSGSGDALDEAQRSAAALSKRGIPAAVVDTEEGYVRLGLAAEVARWLRAPCLRLDELAAAQLAHAVRALSAA
ncbi:MAG: VWA domain-containing protein, partial [Actinomycetota bacterium]|nr:VWA domain-containing protein [Actinomycetota bacterium]